MRKLRLAAAVSLVLATPGAFALGLGDIEMRSALNQPMNAEIRLTSVKPGELDGMIVKLASADAFSRAGIERSQSLQDLRFSVDSSGSAPVVRITSTRPVVEPFLNFLLEVDWPQGRMVREYTVLLDPPVFLSQGATSSAATVGDTPVLTNTRDNALAAPAPIERSAENAADIDFDVELVGDAADVNFDVELVDGGEVADSVTGAGLGAQGNDELGGLVVPLDGEVISLTDLEVPNPVTAQAAANFEFDVEISGSSEEIGNEVSGSSDIVRTVDASEIEFEVETVEIAEFVEGEGEEISLEELDFASANAPEAGSEITVESGDTLYEIAQRVTTDQASVEQMMLALLSANESSFIEGNINLVRAGSILRIPDAAQAQSLSQAQAVAEVASQSQLWEEYRDNVRATQGTSLASNAAEAVQPAAEELPAPDATEQAALAVDNEALSTDARAILEQARREISERDELRIVGEDTSTAAVADAGEGSEGAAVADIDRRLQLAREELSSSQLETGDLTDQATELEATTENLDALVTLRQNEIAALEQQLSDARANASNTAAELTDAAADVSGDVADAAQGVAGSVTEPATEAAGEVVDGATGEASDAVSAITDQAENEAQEGQSFFQSLMADPRKMAIAGVGGLALLGALGTLLLGRRKSDDEVLDDNEVETLAEEVEADKGFAAAEGDISAGKAGGAAAAAAAAGIGAAGVGAVGGREDDDASVETFDDTVAVSADEGDDGIDKDDTMSEVDVYLAYGLHGQAEELLLAAGEREPDNHVYPRKLLDTYNAQGNGDAFAKTAADYHARFGGDSAPDWATISAMGNELRPQDSMFAGSAAAVAAIGAGTIGSDRLQADDFIEAGADNTISSSVSRDFGAAEEALDFEKDDVTGLLDQSVDPAFSFDEADLEATGDFSALADEIAAETDAGTIEFPGVDDLNIDGAADIDALDLSAGATAANERIAGVTPSAADLTLDLDQLTDDISLDNTELLDDTQLGSVDGLEIPDLTADNELLSGGADALAGNPDEMDTMLDLAKAYIDMGDKDSASNALGEIVKSGNPIQVSEAETLLRKIS